MRRPAMEFGAGSSEADDGWTQGRREPDGRSGPGGAAVTPLPGVRPRPGGCVGTHGDWDVRPRVGCGDGQRYACES